MASRVYWNIPASALVVRFDISRAVDENSQPVLVSSQLRTSTLLDSQRNQYYYDDTDGADTCLYRVQGFNAANAQLYDTGFFRQAVFPTAATVRPVNHDWEEPDRLTYRTRAGLGIPNAQIRIYTKPDYLANRLTTPVAVSETDNDGRWRSTAFLPVGMNYVILFSKYGEYGPDSVEISL